mgnify:CR=1 FL=1
MCACISSCICKPFVSIYRCCKSDAVRKISDQKVSSVASPTLNPADPYRRKPLDTSGHVKHRSWRMVDGKMRYDEEETEGKVKRLKSYRSPKVVRDE